MPHEGKVVRNGICVETSLRALGIYDEHPRTWPEIIATIERHGLTVKTAKYPGTLGQFTRRYHSGAWMIATAGHAIALIDGRLTDTGRKGPKTPIQFVLSISGVLPQKSLSQRWAEMHAV